MPCVILLCRTEKEGVPLKKSTVAPEGLATHICPFYFLSLSANLFAYFFVRLSFSLFFAFWSLLFSYFLPHPLSISTPFSYLLPSLENGVTSNIDILLAPLSYRPQISMSPLPTFYLHSHSYLSLFLTRKKIFFQRKFSKFSSFFYK